ncbi:MAG: hypothetical protein KY468_19125, partial [Armatimonadetes bacterium]|nr:hypothetical protein [Armatimonadota bacterium]
MPAISTVRLNSSILERVVHYNLILPDAREVGSGPYAVLYLLHPYGGDHADWIMKTRLEDYVTSLPLVVVLPSLGNSMGCDMAHGEPYERFFADELMAHVESGGSVKHGPENTAIAGAGAGGYAALRLAMAYPYWFGAVASHSGEVYAPVEERIRSLPGGSERAMRYRQVFGGSTVVDAAAYS